MITKAIVYRQQDYQETSKILYVYTPYGKFSLVARGVKNYKNQYFHLADVFNLIEIKLNPNKSMQTLQEAKLLNDYQSLKKDYKALKYSSYMLKLINDLVTDLDINDRLFNLLLELLNYEDLEIAYLTFLIKLTFAIGISLSFTNEGDGFSLKEGKTVSSSNSNLTKVQTIYLKLLYFTKEEVTLEKQIISDLFKFIKNYYIYHLDYKIQ